MSTDFSLKRPNSIKAESIQYIANLLDDGFSFAPLSPVNRLILNKKTGGLTSCEKDESGQKIIDNKGFIEKTTEARFQQAEMIYDAMNNFLSQQLFENFCKFINNQYFIYEGMRLEAEQARYINFINSIHSLIINEKLESQLINLEHIENCIFDTYQNKTFLLDAFGSKKLLQDTHDNLMEADRIFCYFGRQIEGLTDTISFGKKVDNQIVDWSLKYTYYYRRTIYSILILMCFEILWGQYFNNKEIIDCKCTSFMRYCNKCLFAINCLKNALNNKWQLLCNEINWDNYNNYYNPDKLNENNTIAQILSLLNVPDAYYIDENLVNNLRMLYHPMNSKESLANLMRQYFPQLVVK